MMRIEILPREGGGSPGDGLRIRTSSGREPETLRLVDDLIVTPENDAFPAGVRLRLRGASGRGALEIREDAGAIRVDAARTASRTAALDLAIPFVTLSPGDAAEELQRLRALDFDDELAAVRAYWRGRIASATHLETPEPEVNDFHRALTPHLLINTERSILDPSHAVPKVGSIEYGVYGNESIMMITELDRRGFHDLAEQALEPWLHHQGSVGLPGTYRSRDGVLYGAGGYEAGGYNQHHGFILWGLVEHYRYSGRREWLERVVPHLLEGADWIVREIDAHARDVRGDPVRGIEAGLLPPGALEDVGDWRVWLATNAYSFRGLEAVAQALRDLGHRRAGHYARRAERYRSAIRSAFEEARVRAPVVPLRDGSWIPQVPAALHRRGRSYGWISQVLEGPLHLVCAGVIAPEDRVATWILQDYEDNLFLSPSFGYALAEAELERSWFELGGISQQANLLCTPDVYLARGETAHFLRATFNAFAASWFPDTRMMTEHALPNLGGWVGDHYKTSDESRAAFHLRRMFAREQGTTLEIGAALPRAWMEDGNEPALERARTYFGELSVRYRSSVSDGRIEATIRTPSRRPPDTVRVHFRHPRGLPVVRVQVDGREHTGFDASTGVVVIEGDGGRSTRVEAFYEPDPPRSGMR